MRPGVGGMSESGWIWRWVWVDACLVYLDGCVGERASK